MYRGPGPMNPEAKGSPLTPILSPSKGERGRGRRSFGLVRSFISISLTVVFVCLAGVAVEAEESWSSALALMPLPAGTHEIGSTNCVDVMLRSFRSNHLVRALVFMPGATD